MAFIIIILVTIQCIMVICLLILLVLSPENMHTIYGLILDLILPITNYRTMICALLLTACSFSGYCPLNILGPIFLRTWLDRSILNMFIRGCSLGCVVSIIYVPYIMNCWASCIVLLFFLCWIIMILCDHLYLCSTLKGLNIRIHPKLCSMILATQSFLHHPLAKHRRFHTAIIIYKILHQLSKKNF